MSSENYERHIALEGAFNFRDLGGYQTQDGSTVRWRNLFRSGELHGLTAGDVIKLREELGLATVLDLRNSVELERDGTGLLSEIGVNYHNFPLNLGSPEERQRLVDSSSMAEIYLRRLEQSWYGPRIVEILQIIAESENHPVVFHCTLGKDRTGILSAIILSLLGVPHETIIGDYTLTNQHMGNFWSRVASDPDRSERVSQVPRHVYEAAPESIEAVLTKLQTENASVRGYVLANGGDDALFRRLKDALLE